MEKRKILILSGLIGMILFLILPGLWKIIPFFSSAIALSASYTRKKFNPNLFLILSFSFLLLPSSFLTLDSSSSSYPEIIQSENIFDEPATWNIGVNSTSINGTEPEYIFPYEESIDTGITVLVNLVAVGLPLFLFAAVIYAFSIGKINDATSGLVKLLLVIGLVLGFSWIGGIMDWELFGMLEPIKSLQDKIFGWIDTFGSNAAEPEYETAGSFMDLNGDNYISYDEYQQVQANETSNWQKAQNFATYYSLDSNEGSHALSFYLTSSFPLFLSFITVCLGIFHSLSKTPIKYSKVLDNEKELKQSLNNKFEFNYNFVIFLVFELVCSLFFYISFDTEVLEIYTQVYIFILYLLISSIILVLLAFGVGVYTKSHLKETIFGCVYGLFGLFLFYNMFQQEAYLDALSNEFVVSTVRRAWIQGLFVAPTETALFHIFIPAFALFLLTRNIDIDVKILELEDDISLYEKLLLIFDPKIEDEYDDYVELLDGLSNTKAQLRKLKKQNSTKLQLYSSKTIALYCLIAFISNFLFACLHYPRSNLSFSVFWLGLGLIYLASGIWITFIGFRFGWSSAILVHFLNNLIAILLIGGI
jgi:hypothetical protein